MTRAKSSIEDNDGLCEGCNDPKTRYSGQVAYPMDFGGEIGKGTIWLCSMCVASQPKRAVVAPRTVVSRPPQRPPEKNQDVCACGCANNTKLTYVTCSKCTLRYRHCGVSDLDRSGRTTQYCSPKCAGLTPDAFSDLTFLNHYAVRSPLEKLSAASAKVRETPGKECSCAKNLKCTYCASRVELGEAYMALLDAGGFPRSGKE